MARLRNHDFSLRQLQYAVAVAETGGFGSAAVACGVSQPSLSAQVARLEDALGLQLFERHARGATTTRVGQAMLSHMAATLQAAIGVQEQARSLADPYGVTLRVGVIPTVAPYLLPQVVAALRQRTPQLRVHWLELQTRACEAALADGQLDAMLIADPPGLPSQDQLVLGFDPFLVLTSTPGAGSLSVADLADRELLLLEDGHCLRDQTLSLCLEPGARTSAYEGTSLPTVVAMVAAGLGTSVIPAVARSLELHRAEVYAVPFNDPAIGRTLRLIWRSRSAHVALVRELGEVMAGALGQVISRP